MRSVFALIRSWVKQLYTLVLEKFGISMAEPENPGVDVPEDPWPDRPEPGPGEIICYYGCPNSKKAQKLQLQKKLYR